MNRYWRLIFAYGLFVQLAFPGATFAQEFIPDFYKESAPTKAGVAEEQGAVESIDPFSGSINYIFTDLHVPGNGGFDIDILRTYSGSGSRVNEYSPAAGFPSGVGLGWELHFGRVLRSAYKGSTAICHNHLENTIYENPMLETQDGSFKVLAFTGDVNPMMLSTDRWRVDCSTGESGFVVYSPNGIRYDMTQAVQYSDYPETREGWYTKKITDRNGNYANIEYVGEGSSEIKKIITNDGRVISFSYFDSGKATRRIRSISHAGATTEFEYLKISDTTDRYQLVSVTRPDGRRWEYRYNEKLSSSAGGYLLNRVTYPLGGVVEYDYGYVYFDSQANPLSRSTVVTKKRTSIGGVWSYSYAPGEVGELDVTTVDGPSGREVFRHVGPKYSTAGTVWMVGLLISKTLGDRRIETYTWDRQKIGSENNFRPGAFVTKVDSGAFYAPVLAKRVISQDGGKYETVYSDFDNYGNAQEIRESGPGGGSRVTELKYKTSRSKWMIRLVASEVSSKGRYENAYDADGNLLERSVNGVVTKYDYDGSGNVDKVTNPRGYSVAYLDYFRGVARSERQPGGVYISRRVSAAGNIVELTDGDGYTTAYGYDGINRLTSIVPPRGNSVSISYSGNQKVAKRGGLSQVTVYDGFGNVLKTTLGGVVTKYSVDGLGRLVFRSNPNSEIGVKYSYDILNRVRTVKNADESIRRVDYGTNYVSETDENGHVTTRYFRSYGNPEQVFLTRIKAPLDAASIDIERDPRDQVIGVTQAGVSRSLTYYSNGFLQSETHPELGAIGYGRDEVGNMTSRSIGGKITRYEYDPQNRLVRVLPPGSSLVRRFSYNGRGLMTEASTGSIIRDYDYDANGNLIGDKLSIDGWVGSLLYTYNGNDKLASMKNSRTGSIVDYDPDVLGRPTKVSGLVSSVSYWPSGQVGTIKFANGTSTSYGQNKRLWPSSLKGSSSAGTLFVDSRYEYDGVGNQLSIGDPVDASYSRTMTYDAIDRLVASAGGWGAGSIRYDGAGNILGHTYGGYDVKFGYSSGRLVSMAGSISKSFAYDSYGNIVNDSVNTFAYDDYSMMLCSNCGNSSSRKDYSYDANGMRVMTRSHDVVAYEIFDRAGRLVFSDFSGGSVILHTENFYLGNQRIAQRHTSWFKYAITGLTSNLRIGAVGRTLRLTATVSGPNPPGVVNFYNRGVLIGSAPVVNGQAVLNVAFPAVGEVLITASYADSNYESPRSQSPSLTIEIRKKRPDITPVIDMLLGAGTATGAAS